MLTALAAAGVPLPSADLGAAAGCPPKFAAKVLMRLRRAGLLKGRKGHGGGYTLALPAANISVLRVLQALDHKRLAASFWTERADGFAGRLTTALVAVADKVRKRLDRVTVADLVGR